MSNLCPACGLHISRRDGVTFRTNKKWREKFAKCLGYDMEYILNLSKNAKIHAEHFEPNLIRNGIPSGMPTLNIQMIEHWPRSQSSIKMEEPNFHAMELDENLISFFLNY